MGSYNPKLLNAKKWKRKRLRIIRRDNGQCTVCGSKEKLCVHHTYYYDDNRPPWDYSDESLITLCEDCHNKWHREHNSILLDPTKSIKKAKVIKIEQLSDLKFIKEEFTVKHKQKRKNRHSKPLITKKKSISERQEIRHTEKHRKKVDGRWIVITMPKNLVKLK